MKSIFPVLGLLVAGLFAASLLIGPAGLGLGESLAALVSGKGGPVVLVMQEIRLPRAVKKRSRTQVPMGVAPKAKEAER